MEYTMEDIKIVRNYFKSAKQKSRRKDIPDILIKRLSGQTLKSIGNDYGVTQERIRQLEAVGLEVIRSLNESLLSFVKHN